MPKIKDNIQANILQTKLTPQLMLDVFENIAADCVIRESPSGTLIVTLYKEGDLEPGDFAPELHFVVRRVSND